MNDDVTIAADELLRLFGNDQFNNGVESDDVIIEKMFKEADIKAKSILKVSEKSCQCPYLIITL